MLSADQIFCTEKVWFFVAPVALNARNVQWHVCLLDGWFICWTYRWYSSTCFQGPTLDMLVSWPTTLVLREWFLNKQLTKHAKGLQTSLQNAIKIPQVEKHHTFSDYQLTATDYSQKCSASVLTLPFQ